MTISGLGIALGGGAARGWAHIGVLKCLKEAGFTPDIVAGTSIGAVAGGCYIADKIDELEEFALSLTRRRVFGFLDFNLSGSGLISGQRLGFALEHHLEDVIIEKLDKQFIAVATELGSGHEVWLNRGHLVQAMRASYALPGIFRPVHINGRWLIDGALVNPIPVSVCRSLGARLVIAVNLQSDSIGKGALIPTEGAHITEEAEIDEDETDLAVNETIEERKSARALLRRQFFGRKQEPRALNAPGISSVMVDAFNITQDRIARARLAGDPPDLMIGPMLNDIGLFEFHRAQEAIASGYNEAQRMLHDIERAATILAA